MSRNPSPFPSIAVVLLLLAGCGKEQTPPAAPGGGYGYGAPEFKDEVKTNADLGTAALDLSFADSDGKPVELKSFRGKKNVVLVVTRGYPGYVCPMCSGQVSRLIKQYPEFVKRDAEVLVVFPGPTGHLKDFMDATQREEVGARVPFPIVLDEDFKTVERLGIRGALAKPSTYILDKQGQVRFAYVGNSTSDRPSVKAMLQQLDAMAKN